MNSFQDPLALVGRILLASLFVLSGYNKLVGFDGTVGYIAAGGLPMPTVVAVLTILLELGGGLLLVIGFLNRPGPKAASISMPPAIEMFFQKLRYWFMRAASGTFQ